MEWPFAPTPEGAFEFITSREIPRDALIRLAPRAPALEDNRPFNEYFLLRR